MPSTYGAIPKQPNQNVQTKTGKYVGIGLLCACVLTIGVSMKEDASTFTGLSTKSENNLILNKIYTDFSDDEGLLSRSWCTTLTRLGPYHPYFSVHIHSLPLISTPWSTLLIYSHYRVLSDCSQCSIVRHLVPACAVHRLWIMQSYKVSCAMFILTFADFTSKRDAFLGMTGVNGCPNGTEPIYDHTECRTQAKNLGTI